MIYFSSYYFDFPFAQINYLNVKFPLKRELSESFCRLCKNENNILEEGESVMLIINLIKSLGIIRTKDAFRAGCHQALGRGLEGLFRLS